MIVLVLLAYGVYVGGIILSSLPLDALLAEPPVMGLAVPTVLVIVLLLLIEWLVS